GAEKKPSPLQNRVAARQRNGLAAEFQKIGVARRLAPIEPADLVVLAIGVVVAVLGAQKFVASQYHRRAGGEEQVTDEVPRKAMAESHYRRVVRPAFDPAVP